WTWAMLALGFVGGFAAAFMARRDEPRVDAAPPTKIITPAPVAQAVALTQPKPKRNGKPNIVFMMADNLGYGEPGCYGGGILRGAPTPRMDKLAAEGFRLLNYSVENQCTPSRSAIMTGRFALRSGTMRVNRGGALYGLTQWEVTIAELLSALG